MNLKDHNVHFQEDGRHILIVEDVKGEDGLAEAEAIADEYLSIVDAMDEGGARYQRIKVSGTRRDDKYYFDVVVTC